MQFQEVWHSLLVHILPSLVSRLVIWRPSLQLKHDVSWKRCSEQRKSVIFCNHSLQNVQPYKEYTQRATTQNTTTGMRQRWKHDTYHTVVTPISFTLKLPLWVFLHCFLNSLHIFALIFSQLAILLMG